ncbi:hypothetical protein [Parabacteroides merdae]|jgi:hypothetical protein|uniref:hypothetical protein n=1 Tax=Parabacteroides merdae TaxID=46503 RepID=UPI0034A44B56
MENVFNKNKLRLGNQKDNIELQKWVDGVWRLIDESQGNRALLEQDVFRLMFHYKYRLVGNRSKRIVFDRGKAEHLLRTGLCVVDDKYNQYTYDSHVDKFVSMNGLLYASLPEGRSYILNIFKKRKKTDDDIFPYAGQVIEKETSKQDNGSERDVYERDGHTQQPTDRPVAVKRHSRGWQEYLVMGTTLVIGLGSAALSAWHIWNNNK